MDNHIFMCTAIACTVVAGASPLSHAQSATFTPLGIPTGHLRSVVFDMSADGDVVVGTARLPSNPFRRGFAWSNDHLQLLAAPPGGPGDNGEAVTRVSADSLVIIGTDTHGRGIRWVDGVAELSDPPGMNDSGSAPSALSADGSVVYARHFVYTNGLWQHLPSFDHVMDCTDDGNALVGIWAPPSGGAFLALQQPDGSIVIPQPMFAQPGTSISCRLSAGGEYLACSDHGTPRLWTIGEPGYTSIDFPLSLSYMTHIGGVSDDGEIIVGSTWTNSEILFNLTGPPPAHPALLWHAGHGTRSIENILRQLGLDIAGWRLLSAAACSRDGLSIAGTGMNPAGVLEGWHITLPGIPASPDFDHSLVLDVADIFAFLSAWFAGTPSADFNLDARIDVPDIFHFLQFWFGRSL